jgi:hypothetical protein
LLLVPQREVEMSSVGWSGVQERSLARLQRAREMPWKNVVVDD